MERYLLLVGSVDFQFAGHVMNMKEVKAIKLVLTVILDINVIKVHCSLPLTYIGIITS